MLNGEFDAIIFDMDGVITDTEPLHAEAERITCRYYGFDAPLSEWEKFRGKTAEDVFAHLIGRFGGGRDLSVRELIEHKTRVYLELAKVEMPAIPGAVDFIKLVRPNVSKIALATSSNSAIQRAVFDSLGLHRYFDGIVTGDDLTRGKPDPEAYRRAVEKIGVPADRCLVIEDSDNGVKAAVGAGCRVAGITTSIPGEVLAALGAALIVDSYEQLEQMLGLRGR